MKDFFDELFIYNRLVNDKLIETISAHQSSINNRCIDIMSHILVVHELWNNRMLNSPGLNELWSNIGVEKFAVKNLENVTATLDIIHTCDPASSFTYTNSRGVSFNNTNKDVLFHLLNHSSYHRGQVNLHLRNRGIDPEITDYIFYKR